MRHFAVSILIAGVLTGCGVGEASSDATESPRAAAPIPVEVETPRRSDLYLTYQATAALTSDADAEVIARIEGEVVEILVEEGAVVTRGQVLARLDGERRRLQMLAAAADVARAEKDYQRNIDLHARGIVSKSVFEGLKFDLDALQAKYELARLNHGYAAIRSSIDGVVSAREIKLGQNLSEGAVAFRVTDTTKLRADLEIPQSELPKFAVGHRVEIGVVSMPEQPFEASLIRVSPTIDTRTGTFRATVAIDNKDGALAPGMFASFRVAYEKHANALNIPLDALLKEDTEATVYVVSDAAITSRVVETGAVDGDRIEILAGLDDDELVVVGGQSSLRDGTKVLASNATRDKGTG